MTDSTPQERLEGAEVTTVPAAPRVAPATGANGGAKGTQTGGWPEPDMSVLAAGREAPPVLPLSLFGPWADWIASAAEAKACPPDFVALSLLTAAATLIGNSRRATPWPRDCTCRKCNAPFPENATRFGLEIRGYRRLAIVVHHGVLSQLESE